jgi:hypothetical protein
MQSRATGRGPIVEGLQSFRRRVVSRRMRRLIGLVLDEKLVHGGRRLWRGLRLRVNG